jgi:hypothetical protein
MAMNPQTIASLAGTGGQIFGSLLGNKNQQAGLNEQKREFDTQMARKNALMRPALPGLFTNLGYSGAVAPGMAESALPSGPALHQPTNGIGHILGKIAEIGGPIAASLLIPGVGGLAAKIPGIGGLLSKLGGMGVGKVLGAGMGAAGDLFHTSPGNNTGLYQ